MIGDGIKQAIKAVLPSPVVRLINGIRAERKNKKYGRLTLEATWDDIYDAQMSSTPMLSGTGSYGGVADQYVRFVTSFVQQNHVESITDIGCGDFNVGRQIAPHVAHYVGMDVSAKIIEKNKNEHAAVSGVRFLHGNACKDEVPPAQLITIRQVLQHLTNTEVKEILENIKLARPHYVLIAEHCQSLEKVKRKNVDLESHGHHTRNVYASGVYVSDPPFSLPAKIVKEIQLPKSRDELLYVWLWDLSLGTK